MRCAQSAKLRDEALHLLKGEYPSQVRTKIEKALFRTPGFPKLVHRHEQPVRAITKKAEHIRVLWSATVLRVVH